MFSEALLQFIWQFGLLDKSDALYSEDGELIQLISRGTLNKEAGPDFLNAKIKIGATIWVGNIELHVRASDWDAHHHNENLDYHNVILHVVYENDKLLQLNCPTLTLKQHIKPSFLSRYQSLMQLRSSIACAQQLVQVPLLQKIHMQERVLIERIETKGALIETLLERTNNHWEEVFYILVARNFGLKINQDPFQALAERTPLKLFAKHKNSLVQTEALLFGQAGFLEQESTDDYVNTLQKEYKHLQHLHGLKPLSAHGFKFLRLRPANFPTVRLAQLASLLFYSQHLFSTLLKTDDLRKIKAYFKKPVGTYWLSHYRFGMSHENEQAKNIGENFIQLLIINTIIPCLFIYGKSKGEKHLQDRALRWLDELAPEKNVITREMENYGFENKSARDSQALIQLKNNYCAKYACLDCSIGYSILHKA